MAAATHVQAPSRDELISELQSQVRSVVAVLSEAQDFLCHKSNACTTERCMCGLVTIQRDIQELRDSQAA